MWLQILGWNADFGSLIRGRSDADKILRSGQYSWCTHAANWNPEFPAGQNNFKAEPRKLAIALKKRKYERKSARLSDRDYSVYIIWSGNWTILTGIICPMRLKISCCRSQLWTMGMEKEVEYRFKERAVRGGLPFILFGILKYLFKSESSFTIPKRIFFIRIVIKENLILLEYLRSQIS